MHVAFYKYQGTGNDFVILDNRSGQYSGLTTAQVKHLCDRRFGIGADGLMLLNTLEGYDFEMKYYNADGGESSMCGNGGRCLVKFAYDTSMQQSHYHFLAADGAHEARFEGDWVELKMKDVDKLTSVGQDTVLDTGSPHYVKMSDNVSKINVYHEGRQIRNSRAFEEEGINVNFVQKDGDNITVRTYERGVENETLSCGTGVTACALVCGPTRYGSHVVHVQTLGGQLAVKYEKVSKNEFHNIWLCGPATFVFSGEIALT